MDEAERLHSRTLSTSEVQAAWNAVQAVWGVSRDHIYWWPLAEKTHPSLTAIELEQVDRADLRARLTAFIANAGVTRVFEMSHGGGGYEIDVDVDRILDDGNESYWIPPANDWIIYCSHEGTMTLGGLIAEVWPKSTLPGWRI